MRKILQSIVCVFLLLAAQASAQTYSLAPEPKIQIFDANGDPLSGGKVTTSEAGTSTPLATYSNSSGSANANPVVLDASGRATIYLLDSTCYKFAVTTSADAAVYTQDNICSRASYAAPAFTTASVSSADGLTVNSVIVPQHLEVSMHAGAAALMIDQSFFVANRAYQVTAVRFVHAVAETTAATLAVQVTKDDSTDAPGAGVDLLTNNSDTGFNAKSTANTVQTGTLTATGADLQLAAGDRLSIDFSAAATELVGVTITVSLKRI